MNRPPHHLSDEELSALTDEFPDRTESRAGEEHLAACQTCASRRQRLLAAGDALRGAIVEPVDEVTRRRIIAAATTAAASELAAPATRGRRVRLLAVAAVAVITVGSLAVVRLADDDTAQLAATGPLGLPIGEEHLAAGVGALDDPDTLQTALRQSEAGDVSDVSPSRGGGALVAPVDDATSEATGGSASRRASGQAGTGGASDAGGAGGGGSFIAPPVAVEASKPAPTLYRATGDDLAAIARCYDAMSESLSAGQKLVAALVGTSGDADVVVLGFRSRSAGSRTLAMVLARDDCSIITAHSFA